jgi:hypothetical protein
MLEADAKTKYCPLISTPRDGWLCEGSECALWQEENVGPIAIKATERKPYDETGWSTNGQLGEDGTLTFYKPPSGWCRAGHAPPSA